MSIKKNISKWFEERFDVKQIEKVFDQQLRKPLPPHVSWFHTLGSMALFFFVSQVITGILLLIYYRPTVDEAFESVKYIMTEPNMGWLFRQIHAWGANLMVIVVFLHMLRTFATGSYKKPRELTWITGILLLFLTLTFGFTGYLLPWNQLSYWATTVGTEVAGAIPFVGETLKILLRGGSAVGSETLSRFFVMHVIVLPWIVFFLIVFHLFLVRLQSIATMTPVGLKEDFRKEEGVSFYPNHVIKEGIMFLFLLGLLVSLSILFPFELGEKANPLQTPHAVKPEWYFLPMYQVLKFFSKTAGILIMTFLTPLILLLWPFFDRSKARHPFKRPISMGIGILTLLAMLILGVLGHLSETKQTFFGKTYEFDIYGIPKPVSEETKNKF